MRRDMSSSPKDGGTSCSKVGRNDNPENDRKTGPVVLSCKDNGMSRRGVAVLPMLIKDGRTSPSKDSTKKDGFGPGPVSAT